REVDNTGTIATDDRFDNFRKLEREKQERRQAAAAQAALVKQANNLDHASGSDTASACASATTYNDTTSTVNNDEDEDENDETEGVQIDEDLFGDDLDDVEEQLRETNLTS
ncbi:unnamed protein product, partial [Rotaria socialis]